MSDANPPFYEGFIQRHLPGLARRRAEDRAASALFQASYRGGMETRLSTGWGTSTSYAYGTYADRRRLGNMRDRARKVDRDNPIGRSILNAEVDNVVADGFTLQAKTDSPAFNTEAEERWAEWLDGADIRGELNAADIQRMVYRAHRRDGDVGVVLVSRGGDSRLQIVPGDRIRNPNGKNAPNIIDGVEVNRVGRAVAYHVENVEEGGKTTTERIPAENFIFLANKTEPYQIRGESCFAQCFEALDQVSGYIDGCVTAARMATIFGLLFKSDKGARQFTGLDTLTDSQGNQTAAVTLENGMARFIGSKDDVVQVNPTQPMSQTPDFVRIMLRIVGLPFDMPLEIVLRDVSQANLSSLRGARQDYQRACRPKQGRFRDGLLSRVYRWWLSRAVNAGEFSSAVPELYWPHKMMPRGWQHTDPVTEAQAALLLEEVGLGDPYEQAAALGGDYETIQANRAKARQLRESLKLPEVRSSLTRDPMQPPTEKPAAPPGGGPDAEPAGDKDDE